jgi:uncharacterized protein YjiS (DUF1127 family)
MTILGNMPRYQPAAPTFGVKVAVIVARLRRVVNRLIAAELARRERQIAFAALHTLNDRELKDIGLYRGEIGYGLEEAAKARLRLQQFGHG